MRNRVRAGLIAAPIDTQLVDELLAAYDEAKRNFYLGGLRLSAVEGGRFCEAAFRILQQKGLGPFTPIGTTLNTNQVIQQLQQIAAGTRPDSIRLHIPRALRLVYDIRNNRDAAHLADGIDPNLQDATLVIGVVDWVLAEFVRLYHNVSADEAHRMIDQIVTRVAPVVQDFDGFLKVLRTDLSASDHVLVLLYQRGEHGATLAQLDEWARPPMRANLRRTLAQLTDEKALVHRAADTYKITRTGQQHVERKRLLELP